MRLQLTFKPINKNLVLPINYEEILQGFLYRSIQNLQLASFLHDQGFFTGKRNFKLFTFSRLSGQFNIHKENKTIEFTDRIFWRVSSVLDELIEDLGKNFLFKEKVEINGQPVLIESIKIKEFNAEDQGTYPIKMLSPLTIYQTYENAHGDKKTQFYSPFDFAFSDMIEKNFKNKYEAYFQKKPKHPLKIKPLKVSRKNKVVTFYKGTIINAWTGIYQLTGPVEYIKFLYDTGLGAKNSQGFGMFELVKMEDKLT